MVGQGTPWRDVRRPEYKGPMKKQIAAFLARKFSGTRDARMELRLHSEQRAAYDEAARVEGDTDASAWARRVLDAAARKTLAKG